MSGVRQVPVAADEADMRLDRWFRQHYPGLGHGRLEKLLRTGQVRVDGGRVKAGQRLAAGQTIRVPPLGDTPPPPARREVSTEDAADLRALVLYRDDDVVAVDKPPGLAVQGGTRMPRHLDGMLDALRFGSAERPRLVHRLDRDTSGVLLLARTAAAARALAASFRGKGTIKQYWAVVVGAPPLDEGRIDLALTKRPGGRSGEAVAADPAAGKRAVTYYRRIDQAGKRTAWLALWPRTGRTHQLRVHCAAMGTPILGDGKYGGRAAFLGGDGVGRRLHLHARRITCPHPSHGTIDVTAPLPPHMLATWRYFGFDPAAAVTDPPADL